MDPATIRHQSRSDEEQDVVVDDSLTADESVLLAAEDLFM
jgi:hypothetical protein